MFKVNKDKTLVKVKETSFGDIHWKERQDLQECIVTEPTILGEELLIIQKEFAGFDKTSERLDLLALDKDGNLVIIENKTDDTGKDVVWQAIKYASYCFGMTNDVIRDIYAQYITRYNLDLNAEQSILEFLNKDTWNEVDLNKEKSQRIILVARDFRVEVLSTAKWLLEKGIDISCVQIVPLRSDDDIFLNSTKILPEPGTKDYTMRVAQKATESQNQQRVLAKNERMCVEFWEAFIPYFNEHSDLFQSIAYTGRKESWLGRAANMAGGVAYNFLVSATKYCGVELTIDTGNKERNKRIFDALFAYKQNIEASLSQYAILWDKQDHTQVSKISVKNEKYFLYDKEHWSDMQRYMKDLMILFEQVFRQYKDVVKNIK